MDWTFILQNGLWFGLWISLLMVSMIVFSLRLNPEIWIGDAPPEIKAALPPISEKARRQRNLFALPTFSILIGLLVYAVARVYTQVGGFPGFWSVAATLWIALQTFNLVDLLLVDWLLVETIRPAFVVMPGAEAFASRRFYKFHFQAFLKGFTGITLLSLVTALILSLFHWIV